MDCRNCKIPMLYDDEMLVCIKCGLFEFPFVNSYDNENMVFTSNNFVKYSRIIHFKQTIHQTIGMETMRIPIEIFNEIQKEFNPKNTVEKNIIAMRSYLKKNKLNCYIKITNNILTNLKIINPPILDDNIFQSLLLKFQNVEGAFNSEDNNVRKKLLPNSYLLYRFFKELNLEYYLPYI